jgi:Protein of unknown function (DUF3617)
MDRSTLLVLLPIVALVACGQPADDQATIPVSGKWQGSGELTSLSVNGVSMDTSNAAQFNDMLANIQQVNEICGEPKNMSEAEFAQQMGGSGKLTDCTIDSTQTDGNRIIEKASCKAVDMPGVDERIIITGETVLKPENVVSDMVMSMVIRKPSGEGAVIKLKMRSSMKRIGDC